MSDGQSIIDALYSRFLLRDVFAKVVPGALVALAFFAGLNWETEVPEALKSPSLVMWPVLYGIAWVVGFGVQQIPGILGRAHIYAPNQTSREFHTQLRAFRLVAEPFDAQQFERFVVIKEATGNAFWAILLAPLLWLITAQPVRGALLPLWPFAVVWVLSLVLLNRAHRSALQDQEDYMQLVLREGTQSTSKPPAAPPSAPAA